MDVGCGAGRLVAALQGWFTGSYLGTDVVPDLVAAARDQSAGNPAYQFFEIHGTEMPCPDESVDVVCFFSVITHLLAEDAYCYLSEAQRVLRVGGRVVFSFLEFREPEHWAVFMQGVAARKNRSEEILTTFLSREAIECWAAALHLQVIDIRHGSDAFVTLPYPTSFR